MTQPRVSLKLNRLRDLTRDPAMIAMLTAKARAVQQAAQARAPRDTGRYANSFRIRFAQTDRTVVNVVNDAPYALKVEYGGANRPAYRTLGTAIEAAK